MIADQPAHRIGAEGLGVTSAERSKAAPDIPAIGEALQAPDIQKRWQDDLGLDMPPPGRTGFKDFLEADRKAWSPAVKASGVKLD